MCENLRLEIAMETYDRVDKSKIVSYDIDYDGENYCLIAKNILDIFKEKELRSDHLFDEVHKIVECMIKMYLMSVHIDD